MNLGGYDLDKCLMKLMGNFSKSDQRLNIPKIRKYKEKLSVNKKIKITVDQNQEKRSQEVLR